jgi:Uma2 family endonuclease
MSDERDNTATLYGRPISRAEYLKLEETAKEKHEYIAGRAYAMTGASFAHNIIVANLMRVLHDPVRRSGCYVVSNDMKVKIATLDSYYYPDVIVTCEKPAPTAVCVTAPHLIVEVLSPTTMSIDRREKLLAYRSIESLTEYVLVNQDKMEVEIYRKNDASSWKRTEYKANDTVQFHSLPCGTLQIPIASVYDGLDFIGD